MARLGSPPSPKPLRLLLLCLASCLLMGRPAASNFPVVRTEVFRPDENCCPVDTTRLWSKALRGLSADTAAQLEPLLAYRFLLPQLSLREGLGYLGSAVRLRRVVSNLLAGSRPLKVAVMGGSISWGQGAYEHGTTDWFSVLTSWLGSVSRRKVYARNGCVPATSTPYAVVCLDLHVDADVDLVFVEYVFNDHLEDRLLRNRMVLAAEQLARRLLALPGRPAVVLVQVPHVRLTEFLPFYHTSEDIEGALAAYYGLPTISLRNALFPLNLNKPTDGFFFNQTYLDHHPGDAGHKMIADLAVHLIQEIAITLVLMPVQEDELVERQRALTRIPMYKGNFPPRNTSCMVGDDFRALAVSRTGWSWVNEGTAAKPKWGFVATEPGSTLLVRIRTAEYASSYDAEVHGNKSLPVLVQYLRSYTPMGVVKVRCVAGCSCPRQRISGHQTAHATETAIHGLGVYLQPGTRTCDLLFNLSVESHFRDEHKFKVIGIITTAMGYDFTATYRA